MGTDLHKRMTFPDYLLFIARLRDTMHDHSIVLDRVPLRQRKWIDVTDWTLRQASQSTAGGLKASLADNRFPIIFGIVQSLKRTSVGEDAGAVMSDRRPWEMVLVCQGYSQRAATWDKSFPSESELSSLLTEQGMSGAVQSADALEFLGSGRVYFCHSLLTCEVITRDKEARNAESSAGIFQTTERSTALNRFCSCLFLPC
jgi:hypothetical protein